MERQPFTSAAVDGEMSLSELLAMFRAHWHLVAGSLAFALACAGTYLALAPSQYEAAVTVRLGQVGRVGLDTRASQVESDADALVRVRGAEFQSAVINSLGLTDEKRVGLLKASYRVTSIASKHLRITVRGLTPEDAVRAATASVDAIAGIHRELSELIAARRSRELEKIESEIADTEAFLRSMDGLAQKRSRPDSGLQAMYWLRVIKEEKSRVRELQLQRTALREVGGAEFTKPTRAVGAVSVSEQAVQPRARRVWLFSAFAGLLLGVFLVTVVSIRRMKLGAASSSADR